MGDDAVWSLLFRLEGENAQLRGVLQDTDRRLGQLEGSVKRSSGNVSAGLSQMNSGAGQVGQGLDKLATRATLLAAGGLTAVVKAAIDFEDAFAGVRKTVDATPAGLAAFREELRGMAREIPIAHEELARIAESGGALGVGFDPKTGQTNLATLKEFTRTAALLGETTDVSSDQAATSLGVLSNVLGLLDEDYARFGSTLVDLGNKGASTESQILGIAERAGSGAKLIHMSADETLGWSSAIANLGIEVEAGGTSLQTFFTKSLRQVSDGGDALGVYAETAGMAKDEFAELFGRDSSRALTAFIDGLGDLEEAERLAVLKALGFNDVRISRALLGLSGDVDNLTDSLSIADEAWLANSALGEEAAKRFETTQSQLGLLSNNARDAAITIGDELLPIVNELAEEAVGWLIDHRADIQGFGENLAAGIRDLGDGLKSTDWSGLLGTLKGSAEIAKTAFDAFNALPDPVKQLAIAAIVGNKVTGGALGDIAKGFANIFGGALKTIHAAHVTVIGAGGGGGGSGPNSGPTKPGWKLPAWFGNLFKVGTAVGIASIAPPAPNPETQKAIDAFYLEAKASAGGITPGEQKLIDEIDVTKQALRGAINAGSASEIDRLSALLDERQAALAALRDGFRDSTAVQERSAGLLRDAIPWHQRNVEAVHQANASEANRYIVKETAERARHNSQIAKQSEALAAVRAVDADVRSMHGTLKSKNWAPRISISMAADIYTGTLGGGATGAQLRGANWVILHEGTWEVPGTGLAMLQEGEMVVPRFDAEAFRRVVDGDGDDDGGRHVHLHTSGQPPDTSTETGLRRAVDRAAWFMDRR